MINKRRLRVTGGILVVWLLALGGYLAWTGDATSLFSPVGEASASRESNVELRVVPGFSGVKVTGPVSVDYQVGPEVSVRIVAPDDEAGLVSTTVDDKTLVVGVKSGFIEGKEPVRVEISGPSPELIDVAGSASLSAEAIKGNTLAVKSAGAGHVRLAGEVGSVALSASGSGRIDTSALRAREASVSSAGSCVIKTFAGESVSVAMAGDGKVTVLGKPAKRSVQSVGVARVNFE
ncbi:GIN domain-containing protein [Paludibacterium paludis]|nr:DUF2807 domain-containing protein [Paludibacterium paludis]